MLYRNICRSILGLCRSDHYQDDQEGAGDRRPIPDTRRPPETRSRRRPPSLLILAGFARASVSHLFSPMFDNLIYFARCYFSRV